MAMLLPGKHPHDNEDNAASLRTWAVRGFISLVGMGLLASILLLHGTGIVRSVSYRFRAEAHPQTQWVRCNRNAFTGGPSTFTPLSDRAAAALVTPEPESRRDNAKPYSINGVTYPSTNSYVPTNAQLAKFRSAKDSLDEPVLQLDPYLRHVDGRDGLQHPTTDELIQWGAHKWGIPENWLRAQYVLESYWNSWFLGDLTLASVADYGTYPLQSRVPGTLEAYQSLGITQVRWDPKGDFGAGTEPLRWRSTAFNIDFQAATVRFFYDNPEGSRKAWGDSSYEPCQKWNSIGGWFSPYPWANAHQAQYAGTVQHNLATTAWTSSAFLGFTPTIPPHVKLR
jgi:hypothetical protein